MTQFTTTTNKMMKQISKYANTNCIGFSLNPNRGALVTILGSNNNEIEAIKALFVNKLNFQKVEVEDVFTTLYFSIA